MGNQEWAIQRNWQHGVYKTQDDDKQNIQQNKTQHKKLWMLANFKQFLSLLRPTYNLG